MKKGYTYVRFCAVCGAEPVVGGKCHSCGSSAISVLGSPNNPDPVDPCKPNPWGHIISYGSFAVLAVLTIMKYWS